MLLLLHKLFQIDCSERKNKFLNFGKKKTTLNKATVL